MAGDRRIPTSGVQTVAPLRVTFDARDCLALQFISRRLDTSMARPASRRCKAREKSPPSHGRTLRKLLGDLPDSIHSKDEFP